MNAIATKGVVQKGLLFADYLSIDAAHSTGLKNVLISPRMYKARRDRPMKDNDELRIGRAGHTAILEIEKFAREYAIWDKKNEKGEPARRDPRSQIYKDFLAVNAGKCVLTVAQYDNAMKMREAVHEHPIASELLGAKGQAELTLRWQHPRTGLACKARIDWLTGSIMGELKTTVDPLPKAFWQVSKRLLYPVQLAFYRDAIIETLGFAPAVKVIAVQKKDPWDVVVHNIPLATLMAGAERVEVGMDRLVECRDTQQFPGAHWHDEPDLNMTAMDLGEPAEDAEPITFGEEVL